MSVDLTKRTPLSAITVENAAFEKLALRGKDDADREGNLKRAPLTPSQLGLHKHCHGRGDVFGVDMRKVGGPREPKR